MPVCARRESTLPVRSRGTRSLAAIGIMAVLLAVTARKNSISDMGTPRKVWIDREPQLRRLAAQGLSAAVIAISMGATKNTIIGQCYRRGIKLHGKPGRKQGASNGRGTSRHVL